MRIRGFVMLSLIGAFLPGPATPAAAAPPQAPDRGPLMIELNNVPTELKLPASATDNLFVTAVIRGGTPAKVWLARAADSPVAVTVPMTGDGRYQINLADDRVVLALRRTGRSGQCYLFAQTPDGQTSQSAAIRFSLEPPAAYYFILVGGERRLVQGGRWCDTAATTRLCVTVDPALPELAVQAAAGGKTWRLDPEGDSRFALAVTPDVQRAWEQAGLLTLGCTPDLYQPSGVTLNAIPRSLDVPDEGLAVTVRIGHDTPVPGSHDYLYFQFKGFGSNNGHSSGLDLTLHRRDEDAPARDPEKDQVQSFRLADGQYAWAVTDVPPSDDGSDANDAKAVVTIWKGSAAEPALIRHLVAAMRRIEEGRSVETAGQAMEFNGHAYSPAEAADQLERLRLASGARTVAEFLDAVRQREAAAGAECRVVTCNLRFEDWAKREIRRTGWKLGG